MNQRLKDKVIVVTGANGGIGEATVERLVGEQARVVAADLDADSMQSKFAQFGDAVICQAADVTKEADVAALFARALGQFGGFDGVFNNAGIEGQIAPIEEYPTDVYDQVMAVNVKGVFLVIKHAIHPLLARGGGAIVNTASTAGLRGSPLLPAYNASKHAVMGLTRSTAEAQARNGIRVNAICPAPIQTRMMRSIETGMGGNQPERIRERFENNIPAGRYGEPWEVAALVAFLLSDEAKFINGSMYAIDGGMTVF